jgi:hypothetical protein
MDKIFAKVYREIQAEEELAKEQRDSSPSAQASALPAASAEQVTKPPSGQVSALPSASAEPVLEAPTVQPSAPAPAPAEPARDPILDDVLAGCTFTEHNLPLRR